MRWSTSKAMAVAGLMMLGAGCDSGSGVKADPTDPTDPNDPTTEAPVDEQPIDETPIDEQPIDEPPVDEPVDQPPIDEPPVVMYPEGPYGTGYMETIANDLEFWDPWTGETPRITDYYNNPNVSVLVISSAAGWCTACMYEAWDLVEVYDKYKDRGLEVLYTMYEDANAEPMFQDGDSVDQQSADFDFFVDWKNSLGKYIGLEPRKANFPFLMDKDFILEPYYNEGATPLTIVVRTSDMKILYRQVGYAAGTIDQLIRSYID